MAAQIAYSHSIGPEHRSRSSVSSLDSVGTVRHHKIRRLSPGSFNSLTAKMFPQFPLTRSSSTFDLVPQRFRVSNGSDKRSISAGRHASLNSLLSSLHRSENSAPSPQQHDLAIVEEIEPSNEARDHFKISLPQNSSVEDVAYEEQTKPFKRWLSTLRRKPPVVKPREERWILDDFDTLPSLPTSPPLHARFGHRKSCSSSSSRFVSAMKSATITLASASVAPLSRHSSKITKGRCQAQRGSCSEPRQSIETERSTLDEAARHRFRKRRQVLEELLRTEEDYIADLKALSSAYLTIVGDIPTTSGFARPMLKVAIQQLLQIHKQLFDRLQAAIPTIRSEQCYPQLRTLHPTKSGFHTRWRSIDVVPNACAPLPSLLTVPPRSLTISLGRFIDRSSTSCDPAAVGEVASIFVEFLSNPAFDAYKTFCANIELVQQDVDEVEKLLRDTWWKYYDKGIEIMASQHFSRSSRELNKRRALTLKSLLLKPIQRMPRYMLLFQEIAKATPVYDDPLTYSIVEKAVRMLQTKCRGMNQTRSSPTSRHAAEITWLVGQRLRFADQVPRNFFLQLLGKVLLCGCLHLAYYGKRRMKGHFAAAILFETRMLLAQVDLDDGRLRIELCIDLSKTLIEACDNGKGLQCHTAPHSWKLAFNLNGDMYEIILSACSVREYQAWHHSPSTRIERQDTLDIEQRLPLTSPLKSQMRSVGKSYGRPSSFVRRMPIERSATVSHVSGLCQIVIKNTWNKETGGSISTSTLKIPRSQSVENSGHVETLAPSRDDRRAIETALFDVWTKHAIPYPGMKLGRSDRIRAPAIQVARKFSMSSITSSFSASKRSGSYGSVASSTKNRTLSIRKEDTVPLNLFQKSSHACRLQAMDLLPADFDLQDYATRQKQASRLYTSTTPTALPLSPEWSHRDGDVKPRGTDLPRTLTTSIHLRRYEGESAGDNGRLAKIERDKASKGKSKTKLFSLFH